MRNYLLIAETELGTRFVWDVVPRGQMKLPNHDTLTLARKLKDKHNVDWLFYYTGDVNEKFV